MPDYPIKHGGGTRDNGGTLQFFRAQQRGDLVKWIWSPQYEWACELLASHLTGSASTQTTTVTIPTSGFVTGRLTLTFSGGGLASPVDVFADAAVGESEDDLGGYMITALDTAIAGDLDGVLLTATNDDPNVLMLGFVAGIGRVTVTPTWTSATVIDVQIVGTLIDADYSINVVGTINETPYDLTSTTTRATTPATIPDLLDQMILDVPDVATMDEILATATEDGVDTLTLTFFPGAEDVEVTTSESPASIGLAFGGTATDGIYSTTFAHASLPGGTATVPTERAGGSPATNTDLAVQHEADIEADVRLAPLIANANDDGSGTCIVTTWPGVTGLTATTSAPSPGTLTRTALDQTVTDVTPTGPTVTVAYAVTLDLNSLAALGRFPRESLREHVALQVVTGFGAGRTITIGDADGAATILGTSAAIDLNTTGRSLHLTTDTKYRSRYESALAATATIDLGSSGTVTTGRAVLQVCWSPIPV